MGLDIYLYRYEDQKSTAELLQKYSDASEAVWDKLGEYESVSESEKESARAATKEIAKSMGLNEDGEDPRQHSVDFPSAKYPDHIFRVGYCRSSYNDGGINHVLKDLIGCDLYKIFGYSRENDYVFSPDWAMVKARAQSAINAMDESERKHGGHFRVSTMTGIDQFSDSSSALSAFLDELGKKHGGGYSNRKGTFFLEEPMQVCGIMHGTRYGSPCVYLVHKSDLSFYRQALEILIETCDYVLSQPDPGNHYVHWSS